MSDTIEVMFGDLLRQARESKNISLAQISEALKLPIDKIEAIEASAIEKLPPAAYTIGYLKLFSKLVELDESIVISAYQQSLGQPTESALLSATSDLPTQASSRHPGMRIVSYGLIVVALVLIIIWWQDRTTDAVESMPVDVTTTENDTVITDSPTMHAGQNTLPEDKVSTGVEQTVEAQSVTAENKASVEATDAALPSVAPTVTEEQLTQVDESVETTQSSSATEDTKTSDEQPAEREESEKIIALAKQANATAPEGADLVHLVANDDCWIEISDANGYLLFFSLLKKGEEVVLQGQEPFKVFLGRAKVVDVHINDLKYDVERYIRSNQVARFTMSMDKALEMQN